MDVKPTSGLKVKVKATREAIFGEEGVEVKKVSTPSGKSASGVLTGRSLVGYTEVEMAALDGNKHWYPIDQLTTEDGQKIVEEEIPIEEPAAGDTEGESDDADE